MGRQARIKKERRASRAAGTEAKHIKVVTGTFPFGFPDIDEMGADAGFGDDFEAAFGYGDEDDDCPICRELRAMGLPTDSDAVLDDEQAARLRGVMREVRQRGGPGFGFGGDDD